MNNLRKTCLLACCCGLTVTSFAQHIPNWQNKDLAADSLFGISTEKAYALLKDKRPKPVIVAVIDAGVDTLHEELKPVLWVNPKKKNGDNGTYGWSYIGSAKGNVKADNLELTRQVRQGDTTLRRELNRELREAQNGLEYFKNYLNGLGFIAKQIGSEDPTQADLEAYLPRAGQNTEFVKYLIRELAKTGDYRQLEHRTQDALAHFQTEVDAHLNVNYDPRPVVGDDYFNSAQRDYGSPDVNGPDPTHGTHVAGIIAGLHTGIAHEVKILAVRAVPDGDERDKDIANAIRYAADHGAKVINMSFGKPYSQDKKAVDEAVSYALKKDVLLIQAAGNDNKNIDSLANFPRRVKNDEAYIVVGASGLHGEKAKFSNYGRTAVDVFAPGVQIYSSVPGSKYDYFDGTSMAAPVVAGLAALIREYYPKLSARQVKAIILETVKPAGLNNYCLTGGIVNAYQALLLCARKK